MSLLSQLVALQPEAKAVQVTERYNGSSDWDAQYDKATRHLNDAIHILNSKDWKQHMKDTDQNFDTQAVDKSQKVLGNITHALDSLSELMGEMEEAS